jgi:uncharacterized RDD family membrane protein YckC
MGLASPDILYAKWFEITGSLLILAIWTLFEAMMLSTIGTTPGKWLFGIHVMKNDGCRPNAEEALDRGFKLWWRGMGAGIWIISLITAFIAYKKLKTDGITSWDRDSGFIVRHEALDFGRFFIAFVVVLCAAIGFIAWVES